MLFEVTQRAVQAKHQGKRKGTYHGKGGGRGGAREGRGVERGYKPGRGDVQGWRNLKAWIMMTRCSEPGRAICIVCLDCGG